MTRQKAYNILTKYLKNPNLIKHCLACEAAMKGIFDELENNKTSFGFGSPDREEWGMVGLLHDADYELTKDTPDKHGLLFFEKENPSIFPEKLVYAIRAHNFEHTKFAPKSLMDWSIVACDQLTGLIVAAALVSPDKKLASITPGFVLKRFKEKSFAKGASRETIKLCEEKLGIDLPQFIAITLSAMQKISLSLGL